MPRYTLLAVPLLACALARAEPPAEKVIERYRQMLAANPVEGTALDRLWQGYAEHGKTAELLAEYEGGKNFASEMVLGHLLRKALRPLDAAAAYQRAAALEASSALPWLALAQLDKGEGRHAEAAKRLAQAVELLPKDDPHRIDALLELGGEWLAAGDAVQAAAAWEQTVAIDPQNLDLRRRLADSYVRQHLGASALPHLEFIVAHGPASERALALQQIAGIEQTSGHQDAAISALDRALAFTGPESWVRAELQSQLIRLYQRYHRTPELEVRWKKFATENPRDLGGYLQLIELYERLGDHPQELLAWLEKLTALAPKNVDYRLRLARLLVQMDQLGRAAKLYDDLIATQRGNANVVFERARLDVQRDQPQAAGERVAALVAAQKTDESVRGKALEFYDANRLFELAEKQLVEDAKTNAGDPLLALANFYFARHREADARRTLQRLARADAPPAERAAAQFQAAQIFKTQNEIGEAVAAIRAAIELQPEAREYHFLLGELEAARGHYPDAQKGFERAYALSHTPAEAQDADQRLYESLRNQQQPDEEDKHPQPLGAMRIDSNTSTSAAAQGYLLNLLRAVVEKPSAEGWLRVASWQMWSRNTRGALDAADHALALEPGSVATHEFLAKLHGADPQTPATEKHLRELMRLDPANRPAYLRRIGQADLQSARTDEALRIFTELAAANPGNPDALLDVALAQQRAEHWEDALATLKKVYALSPASRRREVVNALLRVEDRLAMKQAAAELLLAQVDADTDAKERAGSFQELLARCTRDGLLDWLRGQFVERRKFSADDYFTEMAYGRILKAQGNKAAAFEVLADAAVSAPNPAESLPELVREAEDLRKLDAAIALQAQLVQIVAQNGPEGYERLAQLQEKNLQPEDAARTWERIVVKFPRDPAVLESGVEFQRKWGSPQRALDWLRRIRTLDPGNVRALSELAVLALDAGQPAEAAAALEQVLAHTEPEGADEPVRFPGVKPDDSSRLQAAYLATVRERHGKPTLEGMRALRDFWLEETPNSATAGESDIRQRAIRDLGQLVAAKDDVAALAKWTARWRVAGISPGEKLLALYAANASDALLDEVSALLAAKPADTQATNAFIWLALQTGEFDRLAAWLQDRQRTSAERDYLMVALDRYLDTHAGQLDPALLERIFPPNFRQRLWQTAVKFSQRGHFLEAAQLGQRVFDGLTTQRAAFGVDLANWYLDLGEIDRARTVLRASVENIGESFDAPVYAALRALYRLLPESERAGFVDDYTRGLDAQAHPLHTAIARAVLASLQGDDKAARAEVQKVIDLRAIAPTVTAVRAQDRVLSAERNWNFILAAGTQLQAWHEDSLAQFLWERALADTAWIRLQAQSPQGDNVRQRVLEVRAQLAAIKLAHAEPFEFGEIFTEFSRAAAPDTVTKIAEELEGMGANPRAIEVYRRVWERDINAQRALGDLVNACRTGEDFTTLEEVLSRVVTESASRVNDAAQRDLILQLADLLEHREDLAGAQRLLAKSAESAPRDTRLGLRLGLLDERLSQPAAAEAAYRRVLIAEPGNTTARLGLAALLDAADRLPAALELLEHATGPDCDARLALLFVKAGRLDESMAALDRVPLPAHVPAAMSVANALAERGQDREARLILRGALARSTDAEANFPLQARMIELLPPESDAASITREVRRLRKMAAGEPELLSAYFDLIDREAPRLKMEAAFRGELAETWDEGRGLLLSGGALLDWQLHHEAPAAAATWAQLRARPDLDKLTAERAAVSFRSLQDSAHEIEALARLARLDAAIPGRLIDWARALERGQRHDEAVAVLAELDARTVFQDEAAAPAARAYVELGLPGRARVLFARAIANDPTARHSDVYLDYARLLIAQRDFNLAHSVLRTAFRNPANRETPVIANWLVASGRAAQADAELPTFGLNPQALLGVRRALFDELEKSGGVAAAVALLDEHAEIFETGMCARLRIAAKKAGAYAEAAALLERLIAQSPLEGAEPANELALLLVDWADAEPGNTDATLAHLKRAFELRPDLWAAAEHLSRLQSDRNEPKPAAQTLRTFIGASKDAAETEKARQMLALLPAS